MKSLENLCLSFIAEEFERFYFAFSESNNENLKRNFKFLQRKYSSELGLELFKLQKFKDDYVNFLMTEHLKFLDERWLENTRYQNSMKDIFYRLPNLTKISCLETNDEILENIAKFCPKIVEIDADSSYATDRGVKHLCKNENGNVPCPELKKLSLSEYYVTYNGLEYLIRNLKSLEKLDQENVPLALYSLHKEDLPKLENVPNYNLVELDLSFISDSLPYYNDLLKICLTVCPKLKSLSCSIVDKEQFNLFNNACLENLNISFPESGQKINVDSLLKNSGRYLVSLIVHHCIMSISQLALSCPKLQDFSINAVSFTEDHGGSKTVFRNLVTCFFCKIKDNRLNNKAISIVLLSSANLENVTFYCCDLSSKTKTHILKCCETHPLKVINFEGTIIKLSFARDILLSCSSLKFLNLEDTNYSIQERNELAEFAGKLSNKPLVDIQQRILKAVDFGCC